MNDEKFSQYDSPDSGNNQQEPVYSKPGPMDTINGQINGILPIIKGNAKKIIAAVIAVVVLYLLLDFFVLGNQQFTLMVTDSEGSALQENTLNVYVPDGSKPIYSGSDQANYIVSLKAGKLYRFEVRSSGYKVYNKTIATKESESNIQLKMEKDFSIELTVLDFPTELFAGQETTASVTLSNKGRQTAEAELVFEGDLKAFQKNISSDPAIITVPAGGTATATIKIQLPQSIIVKDKKNGDKKTAIVKIKYLEEKKEQAFTLFSFPEFEITPKSISATLTADSENRFVKDITIKNKNSYPAKEIKFSIDAEEAIKSWFSFQPADTIESLDASGTTQGTRTVKLWANVPVGTEAGNYSPNINVTAAGTKLVPITMVIAVKTIKTDFLATATKETVKIPKEGDGYKELITESINLQNKGSVDIENADLSVDVACRDYWITFPQGSHVDVIKKGTTEQVAMKITAPANAEANKAITCQVTVKFDDPLAQGEKKQQVISLFLVPQA